MSFRCLTWSVNFLLDKLTSLLVRVSVTMDTTATIVLNSCARMKDLLVLASAAARLGTMDSFVNNVGVSYTKESNDLDTNFNETTLAARTTTFSTITTTAATTTASSTTPGTTSSSLPIHGPIF